MKVFSDAKSAAANLHLFAVIVAGLWFLAPVRADIYQWELIYAGDPDAGRQQSATLCPNGAGVSAVPYASLESLNLTQAWLHGSDLSNADLQAATLTDADLTQANVSNATLNDTVLTNADLTQANLTNAWLWHATLTGANFTDAQVTGVQFYDTTSRGFTSAQLYSTASYKSGDLQAIWLADNNLAGWSFAGQNLSNAAFFYSALTDADFSGAHVTGADFGDTNLTFGQLQSTASYGSGNLHGIRLWGNDLIGWDLAGQNLSGADFEDATFTNAVLNAADTRGATNLTDAQLDSAFTLNTIRPDGTVRGLDLSGGKTLLVRDYDGGPVAVSIQNAMDMGADGVLKMVFEADAWGSTISFAGGIPVALGGTLELTFAPGVDVAGQVGRTFDLFDWTGVTPTGTFGLASPYGWDLSSLYTTGEVTLITPEPTSLLLLGLGFLAVVKRRPR